MLKILIIALLTILALIVASLGVAAVVMYKFNKAMFNRLDSELVSENN